MDHCTVASRAGLACSICRRPAGPEPMYADAHRRCVERVLRAMPAQHTSNDRRS